MCKCNPDQGNVETQVYAVGRDWGRGAEVEQAQLQDATGRLTHTHGSESAGPASSCLQLGHHTVLLKESFGD